MSVVIGALETFGGQMSIDLGGYQMRVPQQFLNAAQVCPGIQHVRGITVAELVGAYIRVKPGQSQILLEPKLQISDGSWSGPGRVGKEYRRLAARWLREEFPIALYGF